MKLINITTEDKKISILWSKAFSYQIKRSTTFLEVDFWKPLVEVQTSEKKKPETAVDILVHIAIKPLLILNLFSFTKHIRKHLLVNENHER